jgi:hypothetical protein
VNESLCGPGQVNRAAVWLVVVVVAAVFVGTLMSVSH